MEKLKIKDNVDLKELEKFGFIKNIQGNYIYKRILKNKLFYIVYTTSTNKNIQIEILEPGTISSSLQLLIFNLTKAGLVEKVIR